MTMPGTNAVLEVLAFDRAPDGGLALVEPTISAASEDEARHVALRLADQHAGAIALRRDTSPAVGESSAPVVLFQAGEIGDFD